MCSIDGNTELNKDLSIIVTSNGEKNLRRTCRNDLNCLPGQGRVSLDNVTLMKYLKEALVASDLDRMAAYFWLAFTPDYAHISAVHFQAARCRNIIVTENVNLHLVWHYDRIFIKPLSKYLLSSAFWEYIEARDSEIWQAAAGLMRTYSCLIRHEIDFRKAQSPDLGLVPTDDGRDPITYERFAQFIAPFAGLDDGSVSARYHYGELRLTRLNWLARFLLGKLTYHHIHAQWNAYLGKVLAPILTGLLLVSTALNAMQVELAVQTTPQDFASWRLFSQACRWISVVVLICTAAASLFIVLFLLGMFVHEQMFAQKVLRRKRIGQWNSDARLKSGVV